MTERISTGVAGLDKLIEGGVPKGSVVLVSGAPGTGKTILGMQFLESAIKKGKKCAYVTIEEHPSKILEQAKQFGFFAKPPEMISAQDVKYDLGWKKPDAVLDKIKLTLEKVGKKKVEVVVIDSISSLSLEDGLSARQLTRTLIEGLYKIGVTAIVTGEALQGDYPDEVTPFLVDGVIVMKLDSLGSEVSRSIMVRKMRLTNADNSGNSLEIKSKKGILVRSEA
jgi:KaiC/GvpD/RAD55 family RecA-like ATPase